MKKKLLGKKCILGLVAALCLGSAVPASAADGSILERLEETDAKYARDISYIPTRGNNLSYGETSITKLSSREVNIYGLSQCHRACDTVYLTLTLEWKVDGSYATYKIWDLSTNNATSFSRSYNVLVPSGYYYRVRGYHAAKHGGVKESASTLTQGILVK